MQEIARRAAGRSRWPVLLLLAAASAGASPAGTPQFVDVAAVEGVTFRHENGATDQKMLPETYGSGVAFADVDDDGDLDLYYVNSGSLTRGRGTARNHLYRNDGDRATKRFTDVAGGAGAPGGAYGMGALAGDYDGDGDVDLYTTEVGADRLYANDGTGAFADVTAGAGLGGDSWGTSAAYLDADLDGDLDLFVADYVVFSPGRNPWCGRRDLGLRFYCDPRQFPPTADRLYINGGDGTFTEEGAARGIGNKGNGLGVAAADLDGDGDTDLYVANDMTANFLYANDGQGRFVEGGLLQGTAFSADGAAQAGMGVDAGDYDGDGDADLVVTNYQLEHNALYRNEGSWWSEISFAAGLGESSLNYLGFGTGFFDYDNDGRLDLFVVNGHVHDNIGAYDPIVTHAQPAQLFHNDGDGFVEVSREAGPGLNTPYVGRGSAFGDYDGDGDTDVAINCNGGAAVLLRNDGVPGRWLRLDLRGRGANGRGIGARVTVDAAGRRLVRWVVAGSGYQSTSDAAVHVGLGEAPSAARVEVRWPDGTVQVVTDVAAGQTLRLAEPAAP